MKASLVILNDSQHQDLFVELFNSEFSNDYVKLGKYTEFSYVSIKVQIAGFKEWQKWKEENKNAQLANSSNTIM